jgi:hypothetical protein
MSYPRDRKSLHPTFRKRFWQRVQMKMFIFIVVQSKVRLDHRQGRAGWTPSEESLRFAEMPEVEGMAVTSL